jgi:hypothetical protein
MTPAAGGVGAGPAAAAAAQDGWDDDFEDMEDAAEIEVGEGISHEHSACKRYGSVQFPTLGWMGMMPARSCYQAKATAHHTQQALL